jgi:hypothetical protein
MAIALRGRSEQDSRRRRQPIRRLQQLGEQPLIHVADLAVIAPVLPRKMHQHVAVRNETGERFRSVPSRSRHGNNLYTRFGCQPLAQGTADESFSARNRHP